jgi:hypothetical protein
LKAAREFTFSAMSAQYRDRHRSRSRSPRRRSRSRSRSPKRHQSHQSHSTHHPSHSHHSHRNPSQAAHSSSHSQRTHSPQRSRDRSLSNLQPKTVNPSTNNAPNPMSNQQPSHHDTASAVDSESDQARQKQRQKQIDFGKNTLGYSRYLELVPKYVMNEQCFLFSKVNKFYFISKQKPAQARASSNFASRNTRFRSAWCQTIQTSIRWISA